MRRNTLLLSLYLLGVVGICIWVGTSSRQDEPQTPRNESSEVDTVEIPGLDWAALGTWTRDYVAVKGTDGKWVGLDDLLKSLDRFVKAASQAGATESIDPQHLKALFEGTNRWRTAGSDRGDLLWGAVLTASEQPEVWGRLMRSLGPGLMAGAHDYAMELRPKLVEKMREVRTELEGAQGEERKKLETGLEQAQDAIATLDRIPAPSEAAVDKWKIIMQVLEMERPGESPEAAPEDD